MKSIVFDIETSPRSTAELEAEGLIPEFQAPGNFKDPAKIAEAIAEKRADFLKNAALSAITGEVCAIAWQELINGEVRRSAEILLKVGAVKELSLIQMFWKEVESTLNHGGKVIGFNIKPFDLPFLIRRSWALGLTGGNCAGRDIPNLFDGRYFSREVIDLRETWQLGDRQATGSLDVVCKLLKIGKKTGNGADFAQLLATDQKKAEEYARNDLEMTVKLASRIL